jgi:hypothetical protein
MTNSQIVMLAFLIGYPLVGYLCLISMWRMKAERLFLSYKIHKGFWKSIIVSLGFMFGISYGMTYALVPNMFNEGVTQEYIDTAVTHTIAMMWMFAIPFWPWMFAISYEFFSRERVELLTPDELEKSNER